MDEIGYDSVETIEERNEMNEIIIESEELREDLHDCSDLNSYCCQEYFDSFESLLCHMEENHFGTLRKIIGTRKAMIQQCIEQYESMKIVEEEEELGEEYWVEDSLDYTEEPETEVNQEEEIVANAELRFQTRTDTTQTFSNCDNSFYISQGIADRRRPLKLKATQAPPDESYECSKCDKVCVGSLELLKHERKHQAPLICALCEAAFYNRSSLKAHLFKHKAEEIGNVDMICTYCEMLFVNKDQVEAHRIEFHTRSHVIYTCEFCSKEFSIKFDLMTHIKKNHGENKKVSCKLCYKKVPDRKALMQHLLEHENKESCVCLKCGKEFKGKKLLSHHMGYYHKRSGYHMANKNRRLHCSICDKAFIYPNQVRNHEINIHGVGEAAFFCTFCNKGFAKQWDLQNHELMHSNQKPFKCSMCPKGFRRASHLKSHEFNVHTPTTEKPDLICFECKKKFKNIESLRKHLHKIHAMTMNEMYKEMGIPYNGRDILSSKTKKTKNEMELLQEMELEEGTIQIEIVGVEI